MAEGVAQVEQRAPSRFPLVLGDDRRLGAAAEGDRVAKRRRIARENALAVRLQPLEERTVAQQPVLDDLGVTGAHLSRVQRLQSLDVRQHQARLVEQADQVLALRRVDAGLAAHRAIHLRQQGRRHLHEIEAA